MTRTDFSGRELVKALTGYGFRITGRTGSHVQLRYNHPDNPDDVRRTTIPLHDSIAIGTLRGIADDCGAKDLYAWCDWIERAL